MSKAVKSVTKAVVAPVKKVASTVNDVRKDVAKAVVPQQVYRPVSRAAQKAGSAVNNTRKDITRKSLNAVADVVKPLGPAGVPLLTAALAATGIGAPLAAAIAAGATTAGRAIDRGAGLTQAGKAGLTSGAISGLAGYGGQALGGYLNPVLNEQLKGVVSPELIKNYLTPALTTGTIQGGLGSLLGTQSFGSGFLQGAAGATLGQGLNDLVNFGVNQFRTPAELQTLGQPRGGVGINRNRFGTPNPAEGFDINNVNYGLVGGKPVVPGLGAGINFSVDPTLASLGLSKLSGLGDTGGFVNQPGSVTPRQTNLVSRDVTDTGVDIVKSLLGGAGGAIAPALIGGAAGAGLAGLAGGGSGNGGSGGGGSGAPTVPGTLDIGRIGEAFVPVQDTAYGRMFAPASTLAGLVAAPLSPMAMPAYFGG